MTDEARAGDARLADRIRSGETQALGELYDRYGGTALATALRVVGSREEAEDVVHDAFVTMWRKIDRFDAQRGSLRAWLMTVVRNRGIDRIRARRSTVDIEAADERSLLRTGPNPTWDAVVTRTSADALREALQTLPEEQRRSSGPAGDGWVLQSGEEAMFVADDLQTLPADRHYALWLIHADGTTVRTGAVTDTQGVSVAPLEDVLSGAVTFAVTVEEHVVEAPSSEPVLTAQLGA